MKLSMEKGVTLNPLESEGFKVVEFDHFKTNSVDSDRIKSLQETLKRVESDPF